MYIAMHIFMALAFSFRFFVLRLGGIMFWSYLLIVYILSWSDLHHRLYFQSLEIYTIVLLGFQSASRYLLFQI